MKDIKIDKYYKIFSMDINGIKYYCKTNLLKDIDGIKYNYYTYSSKNRVKYICVYDDPAKNFLYAVICPVERKE